MSWFKRRHATLGGRETSGKRHHRLKAYRRKPKGRARRRDEGVKLRDWRLWNRPTDAKGAGE